jgi:hypothetical protein
MFLFPFLFTLNFIVPFVINRIPYINWYAYLLPMVLILVDWVSALYIFRIKIKYIYAFFVILIILILLNRYLEIPFLSPRLGLAAIVVLITLIFQKVREVKSD